MALIRIVFYLSAFAFLANTVFAAGGGERTGRSQNKDFIQGAALIEQGKFAEAIPLLQKATAAEPQNADAYNYLGFSHRKLGDHAAALGYYQQALDLRPRHRGANEYLGELYLEMGELEKAEERLEVLDWACLFGCAEYTDLKNAIKAYKAEHGG